MIECDHLNPAALTDWFRPLDVPVPPTFEEAIDYLPLDPDSGGARFLILLPGRGDLTYLDGQVTAEGDVGGWQIWSTHSTVRFVLGAEAWGRCRDHGPDRIVLDRRARRLYRASKERALALVADQWPARPTTPPSAERAAVAASLDDRLAACAQDLMTPAARNAQRTRVVAAQARMRVWLDDRNAAAAGRRRQPQEGGRP